MANHETVIVRKPWGYEYLAYRNEHVALWLLFIGHNECTSMHAHPSKTTGLVLLSGKAELNFISDSKLVEAPYKQMIRRGLFHQTKAVSEQGIIMFEIETPVDKDDLVRLHDVYGRAEEGYEGRQFELPKTEDCVWITDPTDEIQEYTIGESFITVTKTNDINWLYNRPDDELLMFLRGGVIKTINDRIHQVTIPGDVGQASVVKHVAKEMDGFSLDTVILTIGSLKL
jgi:mannose-6-phosphate isomerase-like protein (cupin superfamily)